MVQQTKENNLDIGYLLDVPDYERVRANEKTRVRLRGVAGKR